MPVSIVNKTNLYKTRPVGIEEFLHSKTFIGETDAWPRIREDLIRLLSEKTTYNRALFIEPPGSGKTFLGAMFLMFCLYKLGNLIKPLKYFGIDESTSIGVLNMSISSRTASQTLYSKLRKMLLVSPWFNKYCRVNPHIQTQIRLPEPLFAFSGNSSEAFPAGYDIYGSLVDEVTMFLSQSHKGAYSDQVANIFEVLEERAESRFMSEGYVLALGASSYTNDFVEDMVKLSKEDDSILVIRRPLWFNKRSSSFCGDYFLFDTDTMKPVPGSHAKHLFTRSKMNKVMKQIEDGIPVVPRTPKSNDISRSVSRNLSRDHLVESDKVLIKMTAV